MCGRVTSVLLLLLSLSPSAFPQCWAPRYSGEFRATAFDVSVDAAGYIWIATGYGVELFTPHPGAAPTLTTAIAVPGSTRVVRTDRDGYAYAGSGSRIYVLHRTGTSLEIVNSVDAGSTVNAMLLDTYLFVGTSNGLAHFDVFDPTHPIRTSVNLPTSSPNISALAASDAKLYVADTDTSIEEFSIDLPSLPQHTGSIAVSFPATALYATPNDLLFASGRFAQTTEAFASGTHISSWPVAAAALGGSGNEVYVGSPGRAIQVLDASTAARLINRYVSQLSVTDGTSNDIRAMARSGDSLYVAAGDIGLASVDLSSIASPFPLAAYGSGATTSVNAANGKAWFANNAGQISEQTLNRSGISLLPTRTWNAGAAAIVQDSGTDKLLVTNGNKATVWNLATSTPSDATPLTFPATIRSAVFRGSSVVALLFNGQVWTASGSQSATQVVLGATVDAIARSASGIAFATKGETTTTVRYFAGGDFSSAPQTYVFPGLFVGGIGLSDTRLALFTFSGINVTDLVSGQQIPIPGSTIEIPKQLVIAGDDIVVLTDRGLSVWNAVTRRLERSVSLPSQLVAMSTYDKSAAIATRDGVAAVRYDQDVPTLTSAFTNSYYSRVAAADDHLYLMSKDSTDIFSTLTGAAPHYASSVSTPGGVDIAALDDTLYVLSANGTVTAYSSHGTQLAHVQLEGSDIQPLSITIAGHAVWVSLMKECSSGTCERQTVVLDPDSLAATASMTGRVKDVTTTGTKAYAVIDSPSELRILDIADPLHPAQLAAQTPPAGAASAAFTPNNVFLAADKVYVYNASSLAPTGTKLTTTTTTDAQRLRIDGSCAALIARTASPELYNASTWAAQPSYDAPSPVKAIATTPGRLYMLTDYSIEIWSVNPPPAPPRRRGVR
jgi:hypothetical protein